MLVERKSFGEDLGADLMCRLHDELAAADPRGGGGGPQRGRELPPVIRPVLGRGDGYSRR
jgi:hypothetical protein